MKKYTLPTIAVVVILITLSLYFFLNRAGVKDGSPFSTLNSVLQPTPTPISQPTNYQITMTRGSIVSVNTTVLSVKDDVTGATVNFQIGRTVDFQKITSGTLEEGNSQSVPTSFEELKVGIKILVVSEKDTNLARSVYITR